MNPDRWAALTVLLPLWFLYGPVRVAIARRQRRALLPTGLDRLGVVYMPRRRPKSKVKAPPRDYPIRRRPTMRDLSDPRWFWDGSTLERTLTDCADGCDTSAPAEFGDHGGACLASIPRGLIIPHSGLGIVRAHACRESRFDAKQLLRELRIHRSTSQSHEAVIHNALAIAIDRRWIEPIPGRPGWFRSLLSGLPPREQQERSL